MKPLRSVLATLVALVALDGLVAVVLPHAPAGLQAFFDHGRSVPGKIALWQAEPAGESGNLLGAAWLPPMMAQSRDHFLAGGEVGPVIRSYGMSFSQELLDAARQADPLLVVDGHAGPAAPPNFVHAAFLDDRANRNPGDIVVIGLLSSSVPGMAAFSNRTWAFEQPAPFTYPVFRPDGPGGLVRTDPVLTDMADLDDPASVAAFDAQLRAEDGMWTRAAFALPQLDASPLARLLRRAVAKSALAGREAAVARDPQARWAETLRLMLLDVARITREDGQLPVILLIQARGDTRFALRETLGPLLEAEGIGYLATETLAHPADGRGFLPDGHFTPEVNAALAQALLDLPELAGLRVSPPSRGGAAPAMRPVLSP